MRETFEARTLFEMSVDPRRLSNARRAMVGDVEFHGPDDLYGSGLGIGAVAAVKIRGNRRAMVPFDPHLMDHEPTLRGIGAALERIVGEPPERPTVLTSPQSPGEGSPTEGDTR